MSALALLATGCSASGVVKEYYYPEGMAFVCINGCNRYTRALYGSADEYRLETSDRPVFAVYKKDNCRNISFTATYEGIAVSLDSTEYCKATYEAGRRDYILKDRRWGRGELHVVALCCPDTEGAMWQFTAEGFEKKVDIKCRACETAVAKMVRNGDIGRFAVAGCFEAAAEPKMVQEVSGGIPNEKNAKSGAALFFSIDMTTLSAGVDKQMKSRFEAAEEWRKRLESTVTFNTPDPYINPIGGAMVMAADGAWGGKVWMHGAVGWRMPLPGWRAAYMGDFLGMPDRQRTHFDAYAKSQVCDVPVTQSHLMDEENNLSRGAYKWGTPMYSNGYICRNPENNRQFHHYDMNLSYMDELLWHFQFDADTAYMRKMWPVIKSHLAWEKHTWDPDGDSLYDAYCCIWASDALQYNSGAVTHSSAYNYRGNLLAARIAEIIGEDAEPYKNEADRILKAINRRLWVRDEGHWAEYQDFMGLKRVHKDAALWSVYTPIDCGVGTGEQNYLATRYVDSHIPHISYMYKGEEYHTLSTSRWAPYEWSLNNVAMAEVMHTVLAYYKAGRVEEAYRLLKSNVLDFMYLGVSPANFGQLSQFDEVTGCGYRDFSDVTGVSSRAFIEGLFGITPQALYGKCVIRPGFPKAWDKASIHTPYLDYSFKRIDGKEVFDIRQNFSRPLKIVIRQNIGMGRYVDTELTADREQHAELPVADSSEEAPAHPEAMAHAEGNDFSDVKAERCRMVNMEKVYNAKVDDIFKNKYLSPRSPYTTLCVPTQGMGDWCSTKKLASIDDSVFRELIRDGVYEAALCDSADSRIPFRTPAEGSNIAYTSLWDNYPDSIEMALEGRASHAYLLMAGSTNPMQFGIENAAVSVEYADGSREEMMLTPPANWCAIEQDYIDGSAAFPAPSPRPFRIGLSTGIVSRRLFMASKLKMQGGGADIPDMKQAVCALPGGAAVMLDMKLNPRKKLRRLTLRALSNEVVVGLMAVTLQK